MIQIRTLFIAVLIAGFFTCTSSTDEKETSMVEAAAPQPVDAEKLPTFNMLDANGKNINLSSFKGKKVFVNLWATWCPPCKAEMPSIERLAGKAGKEDAVFVMLSLDEDFDVAKKFAQAEKLTVPIYYPAEKLPALFNTDGIPATFIFDENGILVKQNNGADDYDTEAYLHILSRK